MFQTTNQVSLLMDSFRMFSHEHIRFFLGFPTTVRGPRLMVFYPSDHVIYDLPWYTVTKHYDFPWLWLIRWFPENRGTPKSSIWMGFSIINQPFLDTPIYGNPPLLKRDMLKNGLQIHGEPSGFSPPIFLGGFRRSPFGHPWPNMPCLGTKSST